MWGGKWRKEKWRMAYFLSIFLLYPFVRNNAVGIGARHIQIYLLGLIVADCASAARLLACKVANVAP